MELKDLLSLLGGLALFLYGMQMMSNGLETAAGNKMKHPRETDFQPYQSGSGRSCDHGGDPVFFRNDCHGSRICKLGTDDTEPGCMDHHGSQHRYNDHRSVDRT